MEHLPCPQCGAANLKTDPQCLSCGASLLTRTVAAPPPAPELLAPPEPYWETPRGQRQIALISGSVLLLCLWILLRGIFGVMLIPLLICGGIWELISWSRDRETNKAFERAKDKAELQAALARHDRPDRIVQTQHGNVHVQGFDSRLNSNDPK